MRIESLAHLKEWQASFPKREDYRLTLLVCAGTSCIASDAQIILDTFEALMQKHQLQDTIQLVKTGCFGFCGQGPILKVEPGDINYVQIKPDHVEAIFEHHILNGQPLTHLMYKNPGETEVTLDSSTMDFYAKQHRLALRNCGDIDPEDIRHYVAKDGYVALGQALSQTPQEIIQTVIDSGLRGRGGGGFSTGKKWSFAAAETSDFKTIICNADEGDPGAFMDRSISEGDPHSVIEAMIIAGYAVGARLGLIYIRAEYGLATERLRIALAQAQAHGFLGTNILGSGFDFEIQIKLGAGAFVCGEETALIRSMEGHRGEPNKKPPYPSQAGYRSKPSIVNNVETLANIPTILLKGAEAFKALGTPRSAGTKVFALAGHVRNIGLVEVPMGTTFREIIYDIGGGHPQGKAIKAIQIGGPSGGVITPEYFDTPIDYDSLQAIGSMMGSGGMIVMDEDSDMVEVAKFYLDFTQDESCGKCTPCRIGTKRMYEILDRLTSMQGSPEDLNRLKVLGENIKNSSLCGLGQTAPNPVLSTLQYFLEEYEAYAYRTKKTAYSIDLKKCIGCTKCARVCPVSCIDGKVREAHIIREEECIACAACYDACPVDAVLRP